MKNIKTSNFFKKGRLLLSLVLALLLAAQVTLPGATVFAADGTTTLSSYAKGADGKRYRVTASYGAEAGIPADAALSVIPITEDSAGYDDYVTQAAHALRCVIGGAEEIQLFDISLRSADGSAEYQPAEGAAVEMKVRLAEAPEADLGVVHFGEETERLDSEVDGRTVAFEATGFSVYAFVTIQSTSTDNILHSVSEFTEGPVYLSVTTAKGNTYFLSSGTNPGASNSGQVYNRTLANKTEGAAAHRFEKVEGTEDQFYIYLPGDNGAKQYLNLANPTRALYASSPATVFTVRPCGDQYLDQFYLSFKNGSTTYYLNLRKDENGKGFNGSTYGPEPQFSVGSNFTAYRYLPSDTDQLNLDGKTYGIARTPVRHISAVLSANRKSENVLAAEALPVRANPLATGKDAILKVGGDVDLFTFHNCGDNLYYLTTQVGGATKYLSMQNGGTCLLDAPDEYSTFKVTLGYGNYESMVKITCSKTGHSLSQSGNADAGFISRNGNTESEYFHLIEKEEIETEDFVSYTATKVSISDVRNHTKVIVYTRVWNEDTKRYEIYAVDHDGSLVYCYNEGETIRWAGTQINTLLWDFTVYYYWLTWIPNHYYELQNIYSGKYIAPQYHTGQILSDSKIGINLPGRRYNEYYSTILAWDDHRYDYAGLKPGDGEVTAVPMAQAQDFYFAVMDDPVPEEFSTVETVDNSEHGITMRLINFQGDKYDGGGRDRTQTNVMGAGTELFEGGKTPLLDLVTTDLKENGYPVATRTDKSLEELFGGATDVNHLFLKSTYEESGYFEYDCTQNFATLLDTGDFRVYNQLGTVEVSTNSQGHGWFMPFNDIDPSVISAFTNITDVHNEPLATNNPRLGETLYSIPRADAQYHFGMEMEASFIQSKNGLDAWGHDIIFEFAGDDDMWLYVDGELVLDLGGVHSALVGKINFRTGEVIIPDPQTGAASSTTLRNLFRENYQKRNPQPEGMSDADYSAQTEAWLDTIFKEGDTVFKDYSSHTMKMLYMERGAGASNLHMRFNLTTAVDGQLLLSKKVSGTDKQDYASARFPYQIWYLDKKSGVEEWKTVTRTGDDGSYTYTGVSSVNYQAKSIPVEYADSYEGYDNVFFLKPGEVAEIQFPDDDTTYYIKECHVDTRIYDRVTVNDEEIPIDRADGYYHDYASQQEVIGERKVVQFDNHVSPNALRTLSITKNLYDVENNRVNYPDDTTGFRFRVYIGDTLDYYRMDSYYVRDNNDYYCRYDVDAQQFVSVGVKNFEQLTNEQLAACTFTTSPSGAIDKIPIDFTVEIRNLLIDTKFKIEEQESDIPKGYDLIGYDRSDASYIVEDSSTPNIGIIRDNASPHLIVNNHRGWGLTVEKVWTDDSFMLTHDNIYFAVYCNGSPVAGTVRRMKTDKEAVTDTGSGELIGYDYETSLYYYFRELIPGAKFSDYVIREVALTDPAVDENGYVTGYGSITPLGEGVPLTIGGVPAQTGVRGDFSYTVSYDVGEPGGPANNVRTDTVINARPGVRLEKVDGSGSPLAGAVFTLKDGNGDNVSQETYVSGGDGLITYAYPEQNVTYTLTETEAPKGYSALLESLTFSMSGDELTVNSDNDDAVTVLPKDADGMITVRVRNDKTAFTAVKRDAYNDAPIKDVHFALYRQVEGSNGLRKDYYPLIGYGDLVTDENGVIPQIDATLPAGTYYLCETQTPREYLALDNDVIFTVGANGTVTVEGEGASLLTAAVNEDNELVYTLKIPNRRSFKTIALSPQTLIADFGLDIRYNVRDNNYLVPDNSEYTYVGICAAADYDAYGTETAPALAAAAGETCAGAYGSVTLSADGEAVYQIGSMQFMGEDEFCLVAHVTRISGTAADLYVYEKLTYLPATTIYYEDDFVSDDSYHDGVESAATGHNFGKWTRVTSGDAATEQAADLAGNASANIFGYDPHYTDCATYSNNGSHKVAVSSVNSGNSNKNWPYMEFDFAGTGFDLVSVTGCDTGMFVVEVYKTSVNEAGETVVGSRVNRQTVDTYYGYEYGKLYVDENGSATLTDTGRPLYEATQEIIDQAAANNLLRISGRMLTPTKTYFDPNGDITETPHYYDALGNVTAKEYFIKKDKSADSVTATVPAGESDNYEPNYASAAAEGWLVSSSAEKSLYQIPVIKVRNLEYGTYRAHVEPRFTTRYGHYQTVDGYDYFDLYVDAFRIYDPAGKGDDGTLTSTVIDEAYNYSNEAFEKFTTLKKVVIGAETMGNYTADDEAVEGSVVVDGNMPLDTTRLTEYKEFGPNNELYLGKNMSVAFEICASVTPADVQVQLKKISAAIPTLKITYLNSKGKVFTNEVQVRSATDLSYSILSMIGRDNITWTKLKPNASGAGDAWSSGLVIISNTGEEESLISVTNLKWTFKQAGETLKIHDSDYKVSVTNRNIGSIKKVLAFSRKTMAVAENTAPTATYVDGRITMTVVTDTSVTSLVVRDKDGNPVDDSVLTTAFEDLNDTERLWTVTVEESEDGDYVFTVSGESDGLVSGKTVRITVDVENAPADSELPGGGDDDGQHSGSLIERLRSIWLRFIDLLWKILSMFGVKRP